MSGILKPRGTGWNRTGGLFFLLPGLSPALVTRYLEGKGRQGAGLAYMSRTIFMVSLYWSYFSDANDRQS